MIADNIQRTEGPRTVIVRALIGHAALLGVFFVPVTKELLIAALIGFFIRVFSIEGGVHRYFRTAATRPRGCSGASWRRWPRPTASAGRSGGR